MVAGTVPGHRKRSNAVTGCCMSGAWQVIHADLIPTLVGLRIFQAMPASVRARTILAACRGQGAQPAPAAGTAPGALLQTLHDLLPMCPCVKPREHKDIAGRCGSSEGLSLPGNVLVAGGGAA